MVQLAKGSVEEVQNIKGHDYVIKLTSTLQGERSVYLSFNDEREYGKWLRKTKKVVLDYIFFQALMHVSKHLRLSQIVIS